MAIGNLISQAQSPMDAFLKQLQVGEENNLNRGKLDLDRQAEARAQTLMPYLIRQHEDTHKKMMTDIEKEKLYNRIYHRAYDDYLNGSSPELPNQQNLPQSAPAQPEQKKTLSMENRARLAQFLASGKASPEDAAQINNFLQTTPSPLIEKRTTVPNEMHLKEFIASGKASPEEVAQIQSFLQSQGAAQGQEPGMAAAPGQAAPPAQPQPQPAMNPLVPGATPQQPGMPAIGQEIEIAKGNPALYNLDKAPPGVPGIPKPTIHFANGVMTTHYPSGRVTVTRIGGAMGGKETPQEREEREVRTEERKELNREKLADKKIDAKESIASEKAAKSLIESARKVKELHKLLVDNPNLTGWGAPIAKKLKLSGHKALGQFDALAKELQADFAKVESSRPGINMVGFFEGAKPNSSNDPDYNKGMILQNAKKIMSQLQNEKEDWERRNPGKQFPYEIPDMSEILAEDEQEPAKPQKITKEHVTEENIQETMRQTGKTREQVMQRLKEKGLI